MMELKRLTEHIWVMPFEEERDFQLHTGKCSGHYGRNPDVP